jgi:NitT/TauT family transport system permease protein
MPIIIRVSETVGALLAVVPDDTVTDDAAQGAPIRLPLASRGRRYRLVIWTIRLGMLAAFLVFWQWLGTSSAYWNLMVSSPTEVVSVIWGWLADSVFWTDLRTTLTEAGLGYLLGVVLAVLAVAVLVPLPVLDRFSRPFLAVFNALPKIVLAPLFLVWFGISLRAKVYFVTSAIFFIVFFGIYTGVKAIDRTLLDNTRALGASKVQLIRTVYVPAILTWIISSLRLGAAFALLAAVFSELLGATAGIGLRIASGQQLLKNDEVIAGILVIATVALLLDRLLVRLERHFSQWRVF